jgi:group I intron endonuclease
MKTSGVYSITNTVSGKRYYGSSVDMDKRRLKHWSDLRSGKHKNPHLQAAWNKYGETAFEFEPLVYCGENQLLDVEQTFIDNNQGGYNIGQSADAPARGQKRTAEMLANLSAAVAARWADPEQRKKLSAERKARWANPEYRAKMLAIRREQGKRCSGENWRDRPKKKEIQSAF